jgi:hypothetical protein
MKHLAGNTDEAFQVREITDAFGYVPDFKDVRPYFTAFDFA